MVHLRKKHYPVAVGTITGSNSDLAEKRRDLTIESACEGLVSQEESQIQARIKQIESQIGSGLFSKAAISKLTVELSLLKTMPVYRKVSADIIGGLWDKLGSSYEPSQDSKYLDRSLYLRPKNIAQPPTELVIAGTEPAQGFISDYTRKVSAKHKEFLARVFEYTTDFFDYHRWRNRTGKRRITNVKLKLEWQGKLVPLDAEQELNRRLEALNQKNFKDYTNMLEKAKEGRIIRILEETDNFLKQLASKVLEIKRKSNPNYVVNEEVNEWLAKKEDAYDVSKSTLMSENYTKFYYNLTHTEAEVVTQQPSLLEGGTLKQYQQLGLQWMVSLYNNKLNGILADEMGLGKTIQTISLLAYVIECKQNPGPFLIVVPLTTLSNWVMEFNKWAPQIKKIVFKGNPIMFVWRKQLSHLLKNTKWNVCLTTYEYVLKDKSDLNRYNWQYIIIDEGHKMKNPKSKFAQTLGQLYNSEYRLLLTGTPLQNNLPELWSLLNFLLPQVFNSCDDFEKWFKMPLKKLSASSEKDADLSEEDRMLLVCMQ